MDIVRRIKTLLAGKGWSVNQLSLESEIPRMTLYRIVNGTVSPTFETIEKICDGFNITVEEFFNAGGTNNADEIILLELFRTLSNDSKRLLMAMIKNFCE